VGRDVLDNVCAGELGMLCEDCITVVVLAWRRDQSTGVEAGHMVGRGWTVVVGMVAVEHMWVGRLDEAGWRSGMPTMRGRWETGILVATVIVIAVVLALEQVWVHG